MGYIDDVKKESKKKGYLAAAGAVTTGALAVTSAPFVITAAVAGGTAYFTYKWFAHRAKNGLRF
jgi:hypothetical protein